jgi:hypothetical protein
MFIRNRVPRECSDKKKRNGNSHFKKENTRQLLTEACFVQTCWEAGGQKDDYNHMEGKGKEGQNVMLSGKPVLAGEGWYGWEKRCSH